MAIKTYRELTVWQSAMSLVEDVYRILAGFPRNEQYALGDQIRRSAVSVPSSIAEGFGRSSQTDFLHFLSISRGSLFELMTQLELSARLGYHLPGTGVFDKATSVSRQLNALMSKVKTHIPPPHPPSKVQSPMSKV